MGVMESFLNAMRLNPEEDVFDDDDYDETEPLEKPKKSSISVKESTESVEEEKPRKIISKPSSATRATRRTGNGMEVCVIKPTSVDDGREITETLLANRTVVLNLEGLDVDIAQRIIDFTSGSTFAISGNLQKISHYIFIVTPPSVDISGDFQEILNGSFDVPF